MGQTNEALTVDHAHALEISARALQAGYEDILTPAALNFVERLAARFGGEVEARLAARKQRQARIDAGEGLDFLAETREIRESEWRIAPIPEDILDRRVEITGPPTRKMVINALNSGARVFMADFEDSLTPSWERLMDGQRNVRDAVRGTISFDSPDGRHYELGENPAVLMVRPRGWHLPEKHIRLGGKPIPGALLDFGLYVFHNANELINRGTAPYLYLPKLESHLEAALWREVLVFAERTLGLEPGTIRVTVLIETLPAAFEMDEILFALREHIVGLNCGRWDYIFSYIKTLRARPDCVLPDRAQVGMTVHFLRSYSQLLIKTCHRRGAFAMGGMAAQIPIRGDEQANAAALAKVRADKEREAGDGHDGTWVAHPGLVAVAMEVFDKHLKGANQLERMREDVAVKAPDLLAVPAGTITEAGLRGNLKVALHYLASWLEGEGCVPIDQLMEDAATAEIARTQVWQWLRHPQGVLEDGSRITPERVEHMIGDAADGLKGLTAVAPAAAMLRDITLADELTEFLTAEAYRYID